MNRYVYCTSFKVISVSVLESVTGIDKSRQLSHSVCKLSLFKHFFIGFVKSMFQSVWASRLIFCIYGEQNVYRSVEKLVAIHLIYDKGSDRVSYLFVFVFRVQSTYLSSFSQFSLSDGIFQQHFAGNIKAEARNCILFFSVSNM